MRILGGDIGGTKTLLRCVEGDGTVVKEGRYDSPAWPSFDDLLRAFLSDTGETAIDAACFAVAGAVIDGRVEVTNVGWVIEAVAVARTFCIERVSLINDFYAVGLGVPLLGPGDAIPLQHGQRDRSAPIAIIGAGTGLGEAIVVNVDGVHHVTPGEGGHGDFAPQNEEQTRLFLHLHRIYGHVSAERVISGMGLVNIYTFLGGPIRTAKEIAGLADAGDGLAVQTFNLFIDAYGSEAGNMGLRVLARGGVYLAGGIAAKNVRRFTDGAFVEAFCRKGRFEDVMRTIRVDLIVNEEVGLIGALEGARRASYRDR